MRKFIFENKRIILAGLFSSKIVNPEEKFYELENYFQQMGAKITGKLIQRRGISRSKKPGGAKKLDKPLSSTTYISKGKANELKTLCEQTNTQIVIFINKLSEAQKIRLSNLTGCDVISYSEFELEKNKISIKIKKYLNKI